MSDAPGNGNASGSASGSAAGGGSAGTGSGTGSGTQKRITRPTQNVPAPGRTTSMVPGRGTTPAPAPGASRMVFRPVMAQRRKTPVPADVPAKQEAPDMPRPAAARGPGRGGRARPSSMRPPVEMTATGPFALGPTEAPSSSRSRTAIPRPVSVGIAPAASSSGTSMMSAHVDSALDDDGVRYIDMRRVQDLDAMAPQSLLEPPEGRIKKEVKKEGANTSQALDLSESETEEDEADIAERFSATLESNGSDQSVFLFQFPQVFPQFSATPVDLQAKEPKEEDEEMPEAKYGAGAAQQPLPTPPAPAPAPEGQIGRLDIYRNGRAVLMIGDVPFELNDGCETSFLQQLMLLDPGRQEAQKVCRDAAARVSLA
ncbi:hypothetical protein MCUN1_001815 [Malassezia cuniculi]|uniref:DNA-directed RNA polymerase III subunit RPC4 n=1 Tax=Malassezia cuniculi TaxID=948313 RepID=A0AAF0EUV3_9BASI|nr:hypothetical protein MCUN1_001815 [Malassezia cuniculi]